MNRLLPVSLIAVAMVAAPASADDSFDQYFAKRGKACYARGYDAAHLKQHAKQKISRIEVAFNKDAARGKPATPSNFELRVELMAKGQTKRFASTAYCSAQGDGSLCRLESDGGTFRLKPGPGNAVTLQVVGDGLRMEGAAGFIEAGGKTSDDNLFVVPHANWSQCRTATGR